MISNWAMKICLYRHKVRLCYVRHAEIDESQLMSH